MLVFGQYVINIENMRIAVAKANTKIIMQYSGPLLGRVEDIHVDGNSVRIIICEKGQKPRLVFVGKDFDPKDFKKKREWQDKDLRKTFGEKSYRRFKEHFKLPKFDF